MTAAPGTDPPGTIPLFDVKIPLTPARAAAIRRALDTLGATPAQRRELHRHEHQLITGAAQQEPPGSRSPPGSATKTARPPSSATRHSHASSSHPHRRVRDSSDLRKRQENLFELKITCDGAVRIPPGSIEAVGREQIRALGERRQGFSEFFLQTTHPGTIQLDGDTATGRAYLSEIARLRDGGSHLNYFVYHDRYQRTSDGWKFTERVAEFRYIDSSPLAGSTPEAAGDAR